MGREQRKVGRPRWAALNRENVWAPPYPVGVVDALQHLRRHVVRRSDKALGVVLVPVQVLSKAKVAQLDDAWRMRVGVVRTTGD